MLTIILLIAGIIDLRYRKIPFFIILLLFIWVVLSCFFIQSHLFIQALESFLVTALPLFFIGVVTDKLNGGDIKYLSVLSMALGITHFMWVLIFTTFYASVYSLITRQRSIPLAAFTFFGYVSVGFFKFLF